MERGVSSSSSPAQGSTVGADKSRSGGCVRPALTEHPKAHNPLGRLRCASRLGAVPCAQMGSARQSLAGHPAPKWMLARPAPQPQGCHCSGRTHRSSFQPPAPGFLRCGSRALRSRLGSWGSSRRLLQTRTRSLCDVRAGGAAHLPTSRKVKMKGALEAAGSL